jgi:hypothetical protein
MSGRNTTMLAESHTLFTGLSGLILLILLIWILVRVFSR